jgi:AcrR family transcriptional regulator
VDAELGLRERKKQRTRLLISERARRLFAERGFDAVSVSEIARAAEVSEATVFNYFPRKEDLVFQGMEAFEEQLLAAIRDRPAGESVLQAFGRFVAEPRGLLAAEEPASRESFINTARMIAASPALLAREREILARYTGSLAALLRQETGATANDLRAWTVAATLVGLHGTLISYVRRRLLEGSGDLRRLARDLRQEANRAIDLLNRGLADYAVKDR